MVKKIIVALVVIAVIAGAVLAQRSRAREKEKPEIQTAKVERGTVTSSVTATGTLQPLTTVTIKSKAGGRVDVMAVDVGTVVKAGQLIAKIDPTDTLATVRTASADADAANARVSQARDNLRLQQQTNETSIRQAEEALRSARVRLAQAERQAQVQPRLTRTSIAQAQASLDAARQALTQLETASQPQARASAQSAYDQAVASLASARESLRQLDTSTFLQDRAQAEAAYDQACANVDVADKDLKRQKDLCARGFIAQSTVDTAENRYALAVAQRASAKEKVDTLKAEQAAMRRAAQLRVEQMQAALDAAEKKLKTLDAEQAAELAAARARVAQAEAQLESSRASKVQDDLKRDDVAVAQAAVRQAAAALAAAKANLLQTKIRAADIESARAQVASTSARLANARTQHEQTVITAPRDGVILQKYVEQGTIITAGTSAIAQGTNIVELGDVSRLFVDALVDETDIGSVEVGQTVEVTVDAYPDDFFNGKVTRIAPKAETTQNVTTILVTVEVENPDARLKPGMNASCKFIVEQAEDVLTVPLEAIKEDDQGNQIVTVLEGEKQSPRKVETGITSDDMVEIRSGLKEGEVVVTAIIEPAKGGARTGGGPFGRSRGAMGGMPGSGGFGGRR